jgi:hypothetical protein
MAPTEKELTIYRPGDTVPHTGEYLIIDTLANRVVLSVGELFPEGKEGSCYMPLESGCLSKSCDVASAK